MNEIKSRRNQGSTGIVQSQNDEQSQQNGTYSIGKTGFEHGSYTYEPNTQNNGSYYNELLISTIETLIIEANNMESYENVETGSSFIDTL